MNARLTDILPESAEAAAAGPYIGRSVQRVEDLRLLRGLGRYADDVMLPGMLHAAMLRSSVAHDRLRGIDATAARAMPGVHAVITATEIAGGPGKAVPTVPLRLQPLPCMEPYRQPVIVQDRIRHVGEVLAIVVADTLALAEDAMEAIELDLEQLPAVADWKASAADDTLLFDGTTTNRGVTFTAKRGDADAAFAAAAHIQRKRAPAGSRKARQQIFKVLGIPRQPMQAQDRRARHRALWRQIAHEQLDPVFQFNKPAVLQALHLRLHDLAVGLAAPAAALNS